MRHEEEQQVLRALEALRSESAGLEASPEVEQTVLRAFRARPRRRPRFWIPMAVAAGAALAAVWFGSRPAELLPMPGLTAALRFAPPVVEVPVARREVIRPVAAVRRGRPQAPAVPEEVATDFFPMQPAPLPMADDSFQMVRITLPRTEMLRFGLPVAPGPREARVKADVILSEDGIARAIRFVR